MRGGAQFLFEGIENDCLFASMVLHTRTIISDQGGNIVNPNPFRSHCLEELRIFVTKFHPTYSATFFIAAGKTRGI